MALTNLPQAIANNANLAALANAFDAYVTLSTNTLMPMLTEVCPSAYLPFLAQNLSLTEEPNWQVANTLAQQRDVIKKAIELHRIKGTPQAVKTILSAANLDATLTEPEDKPNYYQVTIAAKSVARDQSLSHTRLLITQITPVSSVPIFSLFDIGQSNRGMHPILTTLLIDKNPLSKHLSVKNNVATQGYARGKKKQTAHHVLEMAKPTKLTIFAHIRKIS